MASAGIYYGVVLVGIGDTTYPNTPACVCAGDATVTGANSYLNFVGIVEGTADDLSTKINPVTGELDVGSVSFVVAAPKTGLDGPTGEKLHPDKLFTRRQIEAQGLLANSLTAASSGASGSITLFSRDGAAFSAGDIVYLEDETIILDSLSSSSAPNKTQTFACTRGAFGSRAQAHSASPGTGAPPSPVSGYDNRVYTTPKMFGRECQVVEFNGDTTRVVMYGAFIDSPEIVNAGSGIKITVSSVWGLLANRKLNKRPLGADGQGRFLNFEPGWHGFRGTLLPDEFTETWGPVLTHAPAPVNECVMQVDKAPVAVTWRESAESGDPYYYFTPIDQTASGFAQSSLMSTAPVPNTDSEFDIRERGNLASQEFYYELLALGATVVDGQGNYVGAATDYHPITAWEHHLMSTGRGDNTHSTFTNYDDWAYMHGCGIRSQWIDRQALDDIRTTYDDSMVIDMKFFGWDGNSYSPGDFRNCILRPFWIFPHSNANGQISASVFEPILPDDPSLITIDSSRIVSLTENQEFPWEDVLNTVAVEYGQPWWDKKGSVTSVDKPNGSTWYDPQPTTPDAELTFDVTALGGSTSDFGPRQIYSRVLLDWKRTPVSIYSAVIQEYSPALNLHEGAKVFFDVNVADYDFDGFYRDRDGEEQTSLEVYGHIVELSRNFDEGTYNVSIVATNETLVKNPKQIAPAVIIKGANTGTEIQCYKDFNGADIYSDFSSEFTELTHFTRTGGRQASYTVSSVADVDATYFTITFSSTLSPAPSQYDFFRLTPRTDASGEAYNSKYAYVADEFEVFDDGDDGDIYV